MISHSPIIQSAMDFSEERHHKPKSAEHYLEAVKRFQRVTGINSLSDITSETLENFLRDYPGKPATIRTTFRPLRALLKQAQKLGEIEELPQFPIVRGQMAPRVVMEPEELDQLLAVVDQAEFPQMRGVAPGLWWKCWLGVAYVTGLRFGDLLCVKMPTTYFEHVASKTGKIHKIPCPVWLRKLCQSINAQPGEVLFPIESSQHLRMRRQLDKLNKAAGNRPKLGAQTMRRLSVTEWSAVSSDAGKIIHGTALGILVFYLEPYLHLCNCLPRLRVPTAFMPQDEAERLRLEEQRLVTLYRRSNDESRRTLMNVAESLL